MATKKGRDFELLTENIFLKLRNDERFEQVERNVIIKGPDGPREIDVLLTTESFGIKIRTVVECKDFEAKVGVGVIDSIVSKMQDVGASKGIVVSRNGFSSQAIAKAKRHNLSLFTAHEALHPKWDIDIEIPVVVRQIWPKSFNQIIKSEAISDVHIDTKQNCFYINGVDVIELFKKEWNENSLNYNLIDNVQAIRYQGLRPPFYLKDHSGNDVEIDDFWVEVHFEISYYIGNLKEIENVQLLKNIVDGSMTFFLDPPWMIDYQRLFKKIPKLPPFNSLVLNIKETTRINNPRINGVSRIAKKMLLPKNHSSPSREE